MILAARLSGPLGRDPGFRVRGAPSVVWVRAGSTGRCRSVVGRGRGLVSRERAPGRRSGRAAGGRRRGRRWPTGGARPGATAGDGRCVPGRPVRARDGRDGEQPGPQPFGFLPPGVGTGEGEHCIQAVSSHAKATMAHHIWFSAKSCSGRLVSRCPWRSGSGLRRGLGGRAAARSRPAPRVLLVARALTRSPSASVIGNFAPGCGRSLRV